MPKTITLKLEKVKETKGTIVFAAEEKDAAITTLYIRKGQGFDTIGEIKLTVEEV